MFCIYQFHLESFPNSITVNSLLTDTSIRRTPLQNEHLELVPAFLYSFYLTLYKTDTSLRWTLSASTKGVRLRESWLYTSMVYGFQGQEKNIWFWKIKNIYGMGSHEFHGTRTKCYWSFPVISGHRTEKLFSMGNEILRLAYGHPWYGRLTAVKKGICRSVSPDCIVGSSVQLIEVTWVSFKPSADQLVLIDCRLRSIMKRQCNK